MAQPRKKATAPAAVAEPVRVLARASHSGDPAVHQLMAEIQSAQLNGDAKAVSSLAAQLAELGYE
jgi:hypothetical protein